ncbi:MAG: hypothetical protein FWD13_05605, partial [Treponema sp.]|nr:hypothetical protein [Treponema sp.]
MKNFVKQLVIITLAVLIGFLFVSCSEPEPELPVITISQQPFERSVFAGDIFSLVVNAQVTQGATLSYQWYSNTTNSNVGGTVISGATNRHYINYTTLAAGTYYYFCEVNATGGAASVRTNVVAVNVAVPIITINTQPIAMTNLNFGEINESLTIEVSVLDGTEVSYQWYSNTVGYHGGSIIADATDESFSIPTTLAAGTYYYYCEVSTVEGVAFSIRSNVAIVNVLAPVITINTQPTPITNLIVENISGSLSVGASVTGGAELSYQWYYSEFYTWNAVIITGATNASYAIPTTLTAGTYFFYCEVSATNGAISVYSETAIVNVSVPVITINTQPTTTIVYVENISGSLSVGAS